jgi:septal ring factor EnvC (AmiA/AmiB activator)
MAERIDDIISKEAFDQVAKMDKGLSDLIKRFEGNANAVKLFNAALQGSDKIKEVTDTIKRAATETAKLEAAQRQLEFANSEQGKELALLKVQIEENTRANKNAAKEMLATEGSVKQMNAQLIRLRGKWDNMSEALRKSPMGAELAKRINLVDTALKTLDSNTGRFQRNVGNYATATHSLSQVLREMPAFTYSAQTGLLGISNNLPILIDQFKAVKAETGSTSKALSVFGSSIFSATNLLTIAIGVITVVAGRMAMMADKTKEVKDAFDEALKSGAKEISQMEALYSLATDVTASYQARRDAVDKLQQQYPDYLGNLSDEAIMAGKAADAYNALNEALINNSIYKAFQAQADEVASSLPTLYNQLNNLRKQQQQIMSAGPQTVSTYSGGVPSGVQTVANSPLLLVENQITATQKAIDATKEQMRQLLLTANQFANSLSNTGSAAGAGGGRTTGGGRTGQSAAGTNRGFRL